MATLTNTKIKDTYDGLLKTTDNDIIGASEKVITDGLGNASVLSIGTASASFSSDIEVNGLTIGKGNGSLSTNIAVGVNALDSVTSGVDNTAIGHSTMQNLTLGVDNAAFGTGAMVSTTTGSYNTSIGSASLPVNTTGQSNTAVGLQAMQVNTTGGANTVVGMNALNDNTEGNRNTTLGFGSGNGIITGSDNIHIGYNTTSGATDVSNEIVIGSNATGNGSNTATYGDSNITDHYFDGNITLTDATNPVLTVQDTAGGSSFLRLLSGDTGTSNIYLGDATDDNAGAIVYDHSDNSMSFRTNGFLEKMSIDSSGNLAVDTNTLYVDAANNRVGIGTSSPTSPIDVVSDANATGILLRGRSADSIGTLNFADNAGNVSSQVQDRNGAFWLTTVDSSPIVFNTAASERMRIDSSGNVGIGGTPTHKLYVRNDVGASTDLDPTSIKLFNNSDGGAAIEFSNGVAGNSKLSFGVEGTGGFTDESYIGFSTSANGATATERMRIDSSGNVGIGTSSPDYPLHIVGTNGIIASMSNDSVNSNKGARYMAGAYTGNLATFALIDGTSGNNVITIGGGTGAGEPSTEIRFNTGSAGTLGSGTERMRITSGGYLKASNTGSYYLPSSSFHELITNQADVITYLNNTHATNPYGFYMLFTNANPNNTTNYFIRCSSTGGVSRFFVYSNGNVVNTNGSYGAISDVKLKENIVDASPKLDDLMQVKVRNYNLIGEDKKQLGVVAQELEEVFPSMIDESPDFEEQEVIDEEGNVTKERVDLGTTTKSVKYSVFVPMLIKAMQEQQEIINDLKARIETLEAK